MKNITASITKKIEEARKLMNARKGSGIRKLEEIKNQFHKEVDRYIEAFYRKKNYIQEALKKKRYLKKFRVSFIRQLFGARFRFILSMPFIYVMIIPAVILHLFLEIYHRVCFPLYGIHALKTSDYFVFDRHHLAYLNWYEKLNCLYCSYTNCLLAYAREIAALTELYWCPIKHAKRVRGVHDNYHYFVDYLDGKEYRIKKEVLRDITKHSKTKSGQ
ncbi:MAG: hypothetical protein V1880_02405 [Patescibacteria group bacterium]